MIVDIGTDFQVPAGGEAIYRCFVIPTDLPADVYVSGVVHRPGDNRVVHHILSEKASWTVPVDVIAFGCATLMHLLGHDMTMSLRYPDGRRQDLVRVDDWDFNRRLAYRFSVPMILPKGSILDVVAHYDNTAGNPRNPNSPPKKVRWGEATTDEMCIGFIILAKKTRTSPAPVRRTTWSS